MGEVATDQRATFTPRLLAAYFVMVVVLPLLPMLISWRWDWWEAWAYALTCTLGFAVTRALAWRRHPDLIAERARFLQHEDAQPWDKALAPLTVVAIELIPLVAGLDELFGWSPAFGLPLKIVALAVWLGGYAFGSSALIENRYFSVVVRPQAERGQYVVTTGPYRWVRHPGYSGTLWSDLAVPILLDSTWAFLPAACLTVVLVVRTALEDKTLRAELAGYGEYAERVRYRLLPGVW